MKKKYHIVYKTINLLNGMYYIGKHSTNNLDDDYLGSGIYLTNTIKKYGKHNFIREILHVFENPYDMELKEKELVNEALVNSKLTYNIATGGQGGNLGNVVNEKIGRIMSSILKGKTKTESHKQALSRARIEQNFHHSDTTKNKISNTVSTNWNSMTPQERKQKFGRVGEKNGFYGKTHSEDTINKIKVSIGDSRKGSLNPKAKSITINGVTYSTRKECMEALSMNKRQFYKFLGEKQ